MPSAKRVKNRLKGILKAPIDEARQWHSEGQYRRGFAHRGMKVTVAGEKAVDGKEVECVIGVGGVPYGHLLRYLAILDGAT